MKKISALLMLLPALAMTSCSVAGGDSNSNTVDAQIKTTPYIIQGQSTTIDATETTGSREELTFSYDMDGNGSFESNPEKSTPNLYSHTFDDSGEHKVSVKVEDDKGNSDIASTEFIVYPEDYLNVDKKSELNANMTVDGKQATIEIKGSPFSDSNVMLRVYLEGKSATEANGFDDIKNYESFVVKKDEDLSHSFTLEGLVPGSYEGKLISDIGPEKEVAFSITQ